MPKRQRSRPRRVNTRLPDDFSRVFISELSQALPDDGFKSKYLKEEIFSKYLDEKLVSGKVRQDRAIEKWLSVEWLNAKTNQRLYLNDVDFGWINSQSFCDEVRSLISRILGPLVYPEVIDLGFHTNGASTRIRRRSDAAIRKLAGNAHVSSSALKHWFSVASNTRLSDQTLELQEDSVLFTVPKKSDIDRVAAKEPEINMLLQRSVGNFIRQRLRKVGVDLNDQTINQNLARIAVSKQLATIDLSSASDTITRQLVFNLLPFEWWSLLDDLRVKSTTIDGESHELEMFSSMGNGFTFELESLLFYAITRVVCWKSGIKGRISVYGDDIIAPNRCVPRLKKVFDFLGFKLNLKKTNYSGLFRESCGKHYYGGFDVSPFYIRKEVSELAELINILNQLLEWDGRGWGCFTTPSLAEFHRKYSSYVPAILHGGIHTYDPTCLVTGDRPRHRLTSKTRRIRTRGDYSFTHWLMIRRHSDLPVGVDPRLQVKPYTRSVVTLGEQTTWTPYLIIEEMER